MGLPPQSVWSGNVLFSFALKPKGKYLIQFVMELPAMSNSPLEFWKHYKTGFESIQ